MAASNGSAAASSANSTPPQTILRRHVDPTLLAMLISMDFQENACKRALIYTNNSGTEEAVSWLVEHMDDPELHTPIPAEGLKVAAPPRPLIASAPELPDTMDALLYAERPRPGLACADLTLQTDLGMSIGKAVAQCCHATLGIYKRLRQGNPRMLDDWERSGEKKVTLCITSQKQLDELELKAVSLSLPTHVVRDAGRTEIEPGSKTVLAVAGPEYLVDQVTGSLSLLKHL